MVKQMLKLIKNKIEEDIAFKETAKIRTEIKKTAEIRTEIKVQHQKNTVSVKYYFSGKLHIILYKFI